MPVGLGWRQFKLRTHSADSADRTQNSNNLKCGLAAATGSGSLQSGAGKIMCIILRKLKIRQP
jgi:hypothetical protein